MGHRMLRSSKEERVRSCPFGSVARSAVAAESKPVQFRPGPMSVSDLHKSRASRDAWA